MTINSTAIPNSLSENPVPRTLQLLLFVILSTAASTGHLLVVLAILHRRELRTGTFLIIFNLSIADLIYAGVFIPLETRELFPPTFSNCKLRGFIGTFSTLVSVNMLTFVSFERFMATNYPFKHREWFTRKSILAGVAFVWLWCTFFSVYPIFTTGYIYDGTLLHCGVNWRSSTLNIVVFLLFHSIFPTAVLLYCNFKIAQVIRKSALSVGSPTSLNTFRVQREKRVTKTVTLVISTVLICFVPYTTIVYCFAITENCALPTEYIATSVWLIRCNCIANPIIYGLMNIKFRNAFKEMLCMCFS